MKPQNDLNKNATGGAPVQISEEEILTILCEEVVPAEGCTEPIALAYAAAKARAILGVEPTQVDVHVSGNMIKNVKSVVIPNSGGLVGIPAAVAMGIVAGEADKELMVISQVTDKQRKEVKAFMDKTKIRLLHEQTEAKLYIRIVLREMENDQLKHCVSVELKHLHTNITEIIKDGKEVLKRPCNDADFNSPLTDRERLTIWGIYNVAKSIDIEKIAPLFEEVIDKNQKIAQEGLDGRYGINIGQLIQQNMDSGFYGKDARNLAASLASAASDARMSGCPLPVMTTSGSGNQGLAASLPLIGYARFIDTPREELIRALFFSHAATVHIKTNVGRLSAYCGVICASAAVSGAFCFLKHEPFETIAHAIMNTLGDLSGIICDGAKASCAMKIATSTYAAFDAAILAMRGRYLMGGDGIIATDIEDTLRNIGSLSQEGMKKTDDVIIDIMINK